jgi:hypothetical protein
MAADDTGVSEGKQFAPCREFEMKLLHVSARKNAAPDLQKERFVLFVRNERGGHFVPPHCKSRIANLSCSMG